MSLKVMSKFREKNALYKNVVFSAQTEYSYFSAGFRLKIFLYYSKIISYSISVLEFIGVSISSSFHCSQRGHDVARCHVKRQLAVLALEKRFKSISHVSVEHFA